MKPDTSKSEIAASTPRRPFAVAIVDDDESVGGALRRLCLAYGLSATAYVSGRQFLAALEADDCPDCLLLDMHMPEMSGIELVRHLDAAGRQIPTIIFTADEAEGPPPQVAATVVAYLQKPLSHEALLAAIAQALHTDRMGLESGKPQTPT